MSDIVKETMELVQRFQEKHPGKRIAIIDGKTELVDATPAEEEAYKKTLEKVQSMSESRR